MNCQQFESRIQQLLDERQGLLGDARLAEHQRHCPACQNKLRQFAILETHFGSLQSQVSARLSDVESTRSNEFAVPIKRTYAEGRRRLAFAAVAAALLAIAIPVFNFSPNASHTPVAVIRPISIAPAFTSSQLTGEVPWQQVLATIEDLPRRLESLGPVYLCTAQMTGVSSLTSSLNLTVDLLWYQLGREQPWKDPGDDSHGRYEKACSLSQTA